MSDGVDEVDDGTKPLKANNESENNNSNKKKNKKQKSIHDLLKDTRKTIQDSEEHERISAKWRFGGYCLTVALMVAYIIYSWYRYSDTTLNKKTVVDFNIVKNSELPIIFLEIEDSYYFNVEEIFVVKYPNLCETSTQKIPQYVHEKLTPYSSKYVYDKSTTNWMMTNHTYTYNYNYTEKYSYYVNDSSNSQLYNISYNISFNVTSSRYLIFPPLSYAPFTNSIDSCGDGIVIGMNVSVNYTVLENVCGNISNYEDLYSCILSQIYYFSIKYAYVSREDAVDQITNGARKIYYSGAIALLQTKRDIVSILKIKNHISSGQSETYYQIESSIDETAINYHSGDVSIYLQSTLFLFMSDVETKYITQQSTTWYEVFSAIGGAYSIVASAILFAVTLILYGWSIQNCTFKGVAPLDPLDEDFLKRLDVHIARKIHDQRICNHQSHVELINSMQQTQRTTDNQTENA